MKPESPSVVYRRDYTPPEFLIDHVNLDFSLNEDETMVRASLQVRRNKKGGTGDPTLVLDGEELELLELKLNRRKLEQDEFQVDSGHLRVANVPEAFTLETLVRIHPEKNKALEGLYRSGSMFCTQCEAEGFRKITYFLDRPDVMSRFSTTLRAVKSRYPVLLSNGNQVDSGELPDGRHWVQWEDPFPKPCYLFALVAGDLCTLDDSYKTCSGRAVRLRLFVEPENLERCAHAMRSLKEAIRWDEERFGREYDLDLFMIVAVNDFNMGAMENKGLNIFNSNLVLASTETATDADFYQIQAVIAHEYFHNWTGNRVTCRDWFQLSLKEGLTVFRDQEFSADLNSRAVKRIMDVNLLRNHQFPEDSGPLSHPVRPVSYREINNFYTSTVYEKGAEVIRMLHTLLGREGFRRGMDRYFEQHDAQAVTCDAFVKAMEEANGVDLEQFRRWYSQAGTPVVKASGIYDQERKTYTLTLKQSCPDTPGQQGFGASDEGPSRTPSVVKGAGNNAKKTNQKHPFHIPLMMGLIGRDGQSLPLRIKDDSAEMEPDNLVLELRELSHIFVFENIHEKPVPSLLRRFSAPVDLHFDYSNEELSFLFTHDSDEFNHWDAGQRLMVRSALEQVEILRMGKKTWLPDHLLQPFKFQLENAENEDPALLAQALVFPGEHYLGERMPVIDVDGIHAVRENLTSQIAFELQDLFLEHYHRLAEPGPYRINPEAMGKRKLRNLCLQYLVRIGTHEFHQLAYRQFREADNMTDVMGALTALADRDCEEREHALKEFEERWINNSLVMDKWFRLQGASSLPGTLARVESLMSHPAFDAMNPNRIRALIGAFAHGNQVGFHHFDGDGYCFIAERVLELDPLNPMVSARLVSAFNRWKRYEPPRQLLMREQLERIIRTPTLSKDVREIVSKTLQ